ncbi:MAG TPA: hypothetical protein VHG92_07915 [Afifellaceae bacterium]|nr:hypothetical protein [Afifellaceae bacterium]
MGYLRLAEQQLTLSLIDRPAEDAGVAGARLAIDDNNTTGQFTRQRFRLEAAGVEDSEASSRFRSASCPGAWSSSRNSPPSPTAPPGGVAAGDGAPAPTELTGHEKALTRSL